MRVTSTTKTSRPIDVRTRESALTTNGGANLLDPHFSKPAGFPQQGGDL